MDLIVDGDDLGGVDIFIDQDQVAQLRIGSRSIRDAIRESYETEVQVTVCVPVEFQVSPGAGELMVMATETC